MTFERIEQNAQEYNRGFGIAHILLRGIAMSFAVLAAISILLNTYTAATILLILAIGFLIIAENIPYSRETRDLFERYIKHLLAETSSQRKLVITKELKEVEVRIHRLKQQAERLRRNRQIALQLSLGKALEKNKRLSETCLTATSNALQHERDMRVELEGFEYEFDQLFKKAVQAIETYLATATPGLIEKSDFAHYINGLVENAKKL